MTLSSLSRRDSAAAVSMDFSIIVPAYNDAAALGTVLRGLSEYLPRVAVVDDGSGDRTAEVALGSGATV